MDPDFAEVAETAGSFMPRWSRRVDRAGASWRTRVAAWGTTIVLLLLAATYTSRRASASG